MDGDPDRIRGLAHRVERLADELRDQAAALGAAARDVPWRGEAAEAMRRQCHRQLASLHRCAAAHDRAAAALHRHADDVAARRDALAQVVP